MKIEINTLESMPDTLLYTGFENENCLFFDIETTGFSPKMSHLYMIGCVYYANNAWECIQWIAEDKNAEVDVLNAFFDFCKNYSVLIHFNGEGFDLPYLRQKAEHYEITYPLDSYTSIDLFKSVSLMKKFLRLENYKQKSIEHFLGIYRDDQYTGGELIEVYADYRKTNDAESYYLLLLHNKDDLEGMTRILPILAYEQLLYGNFNFESMEGNEEATEIIFTCVLDKPLPVRISMNYDKLYMTAYNSTLKIKVPVFHGELRFFFPNYKDYYYLPAEDQAIHKSVASYVDKDYRTQAKAANCYVRKTGTFLPQFCEQTDYTFRLELKDAVSYFEYDEQFFADAQRINGYLADIITHM